MHRPNLFSKKLKKKAPQALSPLALLTLAACGGGSEDNGAGENAALSFSTNENATSLLIGSVLSGSESNATSTYALSGEDAALFELSAGAELSLKEAANFEIDDSYSITIEVTTTKAAEVEGEEPTVTTATRDYTVSVVNVNDPASGALTVSGTPAQGETLTADTSAISDEDGVGTISYQWYRDGELITGEASSELALTQADVGSAISADISYVDGSGATETFQSASTAAVSNTNDVPTGAPVITGTFSQDRELSVDISSIADADGLGDFSYQWNRDGAAIEGATAATYTLSEADVGANISVTVSYTDGYGAAESVVSAETADIAKANDAPTGSLVISGTAAEGDILTLDTSSIADVDGVVGGFSYVWMKDGAVLAGETGSTYTLTQADVGSVFSASVSYVDGLGVTETLSAEPTAAVANVNDDPTGSLALSGTLEKGSTLTLDSSSIADEDGLGEFSITWLSDDTPIAGATGATYTLSVDEVGKTISATIEYTDGQGTVETVTSAATSTVKDVIVESIGAISAVNTGSGANMVLEFYADDSLVGASVTSFDAVVTFDTGEASYVSADIQTGYLGFPNEADGAINLSGISLSGGSSSDPLFTLTLTDQNASEDLAVYVSDVLVNNEALDGSTLLIA
ncbi:hypothetical protein PQY68_06055 [Planktomarina temperata]|nr:hypothetical protein [Planktomarina temperata]